MRKLISSFGFLCAALLILASPAAHAQATRTWVSGVGDDVNPCSRTAPCKTFAGAISKTAAGGEIDVIDPGGYGAVTITKSITIDGGGTMASILASGTNGINVNAGASDVIILRNLSINGAGTTLGLNGVNMLAGRKLIVENCTIENFSQSAISIAPSGAAQVVISASTLKASAFGVTVTTANASSPVSVMVTKTLTNLNSNAGISATVPAGKPGMGVFLDQIVSEFNSSGVLASGSGAIVTLGNSVIQGNSNGVVQTGGGSVSSFKNNAISNNGVDGTPLTGISLN